MWAIFVMGIPPFAMSAASCCCSGESYGQPPATPASQGPPSPAPEQRYCPRHGVELRYNPGKEGKPGWWSHKTAEGWCKGK